MRKRCNIVQKNVNPKTKSASCGKNVSTQKKKMRAKFINNVTSCGKYANAQTMQQPAANMQMCKQCNGQRQNVNL